MQKVAKIKKQLIEGGREMRLEIDDLTKQRHESLYVDGDYGQIAAMIEGGDRNYVRACLKAGIAPVSIATAAKIFYGKKAKAKEAVNAA